MHFAFLTAVQAQAVPLEKQASDEETLDGLHFRIASGEHVDRPVSAHDETWGLSVYDENAGYVTPLPSAAPRVTFAQECVHAARSVAHYAQSQC